MGVKKICTFKVSVCVNCVYCVFSLSLCVCVWSQENQSSEPQSKASLVVTPQAPLWEKCSGKGPNLVPSSSSSASNSSKEKFHLVRATVEKQ